MYNLKTLVGNISLDEILPSYDLVIIQSNPNMKIPFGISKILLKKIGIRKLEKYINHKYKLNNYMKEGDIRITPGFKIKGDIMFIRFPINESEDSINKLLNTINEMLYLIKLNDYKNIFLVDIDLSINGFDQRKVSKELSKRIKEFSKIEDKNIDIYLEK